MLISIPKMRVKTEWLLREIDVVFPALPMPVSEELTSHQVDCEDCDDVRKYLEAYRYKEISDDILIRRLRMLLSTLSPVAYRWILPNYLKFCLNSEWCRAQDAVYFLVFNLGPNPEFESETYSRLQTLSIEQINCLIHFLQWCTGIEDSVYIEEDIDKAFNFLQKLITKIKPT